MSSGCGRGYNRFSVYSERLSLWNEAMRPFMKYARDTVFGESWLGSVYRKISPSDRLFEIVFDPRQKVPVGRFTLYLSKLSPRLNDFSLVLYVSAQSTKKRPSQVASITRALYSVARRYRGEAITALLAPKGATRSAYRDLRSRNIIVARGPGELLDLLANFFSKRWERLLAALRGKRVYGPLALLMLVLSEILDMLDVRAEPYIYEALYEAIITGKPVSADMLDKG